MKGLASGEVMRLRDRLLELKTGASLGAILDAAGGPSRRVDTGGGDVAG